MEPVIGNTPASAAIETRTAAKREAASIEIVGPSSGLEVRVSTRGAVMITKRNLRGLFNVAFYVAMIVVATSALADASRVKVTWAPFDTLSEVKQNQMQRGWLRPEDWTKELGNYLSERANAQLPPGQQLEVTIDDIKLAGDYEPWRGPRAQDIRVMKDIYPPRIELHYRLIGADGTTLRESQNKLRDLSYLQNNVMPTDTDPLRYDKHMIDTWVRTEFRRDKT
jgi:Protein of unknown function (DUF3016)